MPNRVLLTDFAWPDVRVEEAVLAEAGIELVVAPCADEATLVALAGDVQGILTCWARVPAAVIDAARQCRVVSRLGVGLDNIDVAAARRRGIIVTNVPDYCQTEVAEHTLALVLALGRRVTEFFRRGQSGIYDREIAPPLRRIKGQVLGLVGCGSIGRQVARKAQGLGMTILAVTRGGGELPAGVVRVGLDELLAKSDYVSLHLPLSDETRHILGADALRRMKPTAFLINTARGGLVDHAALAAALARGELGGAALDVQDPEPPDLSQPPFSDPRVIVTPHVAFLSEESLLELRTRACRQVVDCLAGRRPENVVVG
ncbi:MAG: C-terminal binding protein [Planctomycetia bacterium]|nr:C-terminal binding protein [Planctomycetia bacterium]